MRGERGITTVEVLMSLLLVMLGLAALFSTLAAGVQGTSAASRFEQAQQRAMSLIEAIRRSSPQTIACLASTQATGWSACELTCRNTLADGGVAVPQACILTTETMALVPGPPAGPSATANLSVDRSGQQYALVFDPGQPLESTFVQATGPGGRVVDVQIVIGWNDDGTASSTTPQHRHRVRTGFFQ